MGYIMSSDSDDDCSYTNSVTLLKAITKKNINVDSDIDTSKTNALDFFDISTSSETEPKKHVLRPTSKHQQTNDTEIIDLDLVKETKNNDSCIILSDNETDVTPVNIISAIDDILQKGRGSAKRGRGRKGRGRGKRKQSPRQTRQSKRLKQSEKTEPSISFLDNSVCVVEDAPDIDNVNYELTVKVYWKSQNLIKFTIRRFDTLTSIFEHFAKEENVPENRLLFTIKDKIISKNDTPENLNITAATIIEGGILSAKTNLGSSKTQDKDKLEFKIQMKDRKHPLLISLKRNDRMEVLMCKCAGELNVPVKTLKFYFDGDVIKSSKTPEELDLEGGEVIDCVKV